MICFHLLSPFCQDAPSSFPGGAEERRVDYSGPHTPAPQEPLRSSDLGRKWPRSAGPSETPCGPGAQALHGPWGGGEERSAAGPPGWRWGAVHAPEQLLLLNWLTVIPLKTQAHLKYCGRSLDGRETQGGFSWRGLVILPSLKALCPPAPPGLPPLRAALSPPPSP